MGAIPGTKQEIFDIVYKGLASQDWLRSYNQKAGMCQYRTVRSGRRLKCAAGHLIPDKDYEHIKSFNDCSWLVVSAHLAHLDASYEEHISFIQGLQAIHDGFTKTENGTLKEAFDKFAKNNNLTIPTV